MPRKDAIKRIGKKRKHDRFKEDTPAKPESCSANILRGSVSQGLINDHTGSYSNMKLAHLWIQDCLQNHDLCKAGSSGGDSSFLPTRLIDIRDPKRPFLEVTSPGLRAKYIALSYAWGEGRRIVSTKENYQDHKRCIPPESLPKTFADAFHATRLLGYRYIWVDAFCIKQDDVADLHSELPRMGDIYRYAAFTIFAEGAPNAAAGLFQTRDPHLYRPCTVDVTMPTQKGIASNKLTLATVHTGHNYLKARGWVLQEEILTSRRLSFGKQMTWRCTANEASETRPYPRPRTNPLKEGLATSEDKLRLWLLAPTQMLNTPRKSWSRWNQYDAWYAVIEEYSSKQLTVDSDKLPALSGLAGLFHAAHHSTYAAGLWKEDLQLGLAWYVASNDPRPVKTDRGQEPSWSWASVGMVCLKFRSWKPNFKHIESAGAGIVDISCMLDTLLNPYGRVNQGTLKLRIPLKRAMLRCSAEYAINRTEYSYGSYSGPDSSTMTDGEHPRFAAPVYDLETFEFIGEAALDAPIHACLDIGVDNATHLVLQEKSTKNTFEKEIWCGLLHLQQKDSSSCRLTGLILEKTQPGGTVYRRLGLLFINHYAPEETRHSLWQEEIIEVH